MQPIQTRVESVILYHRGATVRRVAQLDCKAEVPSQLMVIGLPLALLDHTLRVRVESGKGEVILSNVRVGLHAAPRGTVERSPDEKELRAVHKAIEVQQEKIAVVVSELDRLRSFPVLPRPTAQDGKLPNASPMPARFALETLADEAVTARISEARTLREGLTKLNEQAAALQRKVTLASTATQVRPDELTKSVHATVVSRGAEGQQVKLVLEYFVVGARWAPAYQCRMSRDCRQAEVQLRAMVCQRTGEDWQGALLQLSTASPMSWTELPELSAIKIGKAQPPATRQRGFRPPPIGAAGLFSDFDRGLSQARAALPVISGWQLPQVRVPEPVPPPEMRSLRKEVANELSFKVTAVSAGPGAMPPMPPPSMPMGMAAGMAPPSIRMPSPAAPPPQRMKAKRAARVEEAAMEEADEMPPEPEPSEAGASFDVVMYASLRLSAAIESSRGKLTPVERRQAYLESLAVLNLSATFDVIAVVSAAESQGAQIHNQSPPAGLADVREAAGFYDYVYRTDAAVDVPSDGTFHSLPVSTRTATGEVLYVTVPREDTLVYRQAMVKNPLASPLLPGPVEVYVAGEYVLTTALPAVAPGGDFKLSLGVEQAIKVARNAKYREQRSGDKVVATNELIHEIDIELVNNLDREVQCEVRERIPQPAPDAEVVVDEGPITPAWDPYTQEERGQVIEGGRRWRIGVKAGATQKLGAQYRVKLYANNELTGGNRREA